MQVLYSLDLINERGPGATGRLDVEEAFARVGEHFELPEGARAFAKELVSGVTGGRAALDELIQRHARNWKLSRMATVDRNILRLAAHEIVHSDVPTPVVIDEAIELARRFGDDPTPAFVNGVLDSLAAEVRGGESS